MSAYKYNLSRKCVLALNLNDSTYLKECAASKNKQADKWRTRFKSEHCM